MADVYETGAISPENDVNVSRMRNRTLRGNFRKFEEESAACQSAGQVHDRSNGTDTSDRVHDSALSLNITSSESLRTDHLPMNRNRCCRKTGSSEDARVPYVSIGLHAL